MPNQIFRPRGATIISIILYALAALGVGIPLVNTLLGRDSWQAVLSALCTMALVAYFGYWLFGFPRLVISEEEIEIQNPTRTIHVPWATLAAVDTKFSLTLLTEAGKFTVWAAPSPSVRQARRASAKDYKGLPESSYGPGRSVRPGDLKHTDSGLAAFLIRSRWSRMVETGAFEGVSATGESGSGATVPTTSWNWFQIVLGLALIAAWAIVSWTLLG